MCLRNSLCHGSLNEWRDCEGTRESGFMAALIIRCQKEQERQPLLCANIWNGSSEAGTVHSYTRYMRMISFLPNPIKRDLQEPARFSNDTEISGDNGIVCFPKDRLDLEVSLGRKANALEPALLLRHLLNGVDAPFTRGLPYLGSLT